MQKEFIKNVPVSKLKPYEESQLDIIVNISKHLILNSKNIENEFVEIVNNNFWDLI